jgi:hypothetical protein
VCACGAVDGAGSFCFSVKSSLVPLVAGDRLWKTSEPNIIILLN